MKLVLIFDAAESADKVNNLDMAKAIYDVQKDLPCVDIGNVARMLHAQDDFDKCYHDHLLSQHCVMPEEK